MMQLRGGPGPGAADCGHGVSPGTAVHAVVAGEPQSPTRSASASSVLPGAAGQPMHEQNAFEQASRVVHTDLRPHRAAGTAVGSGPMNAGAAAAGTGSGAAPVAPSGGGARDAVHTTSGMIGDPFHVPAAQCAAAAHASAHPSDSQRHSSADQAATARVEASAWPAGSVSSESFMHSTSGQTAAPQHTQQGSATGSSAVRTGCTSGAHEAPTCLDTACSGSTAAQHSTQHAAWQGGPPQDDSGSCPPSEAQLMPQRSDLRFAGGVFDDGSTTHSVAQHCASAGGAHVPQHAQQQPRAAGSASLDACWLAAEVTGGGSMRSTHSTAASGSAGSVDDVRRRSQRSAGSVDACSRDDCCMPGDQMTEAWCGGHQSRSDDSGRTAGPPASLRDDGPHGQGPHDHSPAEMPQASDGRIHLDRQDVLGDGSGGPPGVLRFDRAIHCTGCSR
eukprot:jgi/Ulvmu1/1007/UM103_0035.1